MDDLSENRKNIKKNLMKTQVYLGSPSYEVLLHMPVVDRDMLVTEYNNKIKQEQKAMKN